MVKICLTDALENSYLISQHWLKLKQKTPELFVFQCIFPLLLLLFAHRNQWLYFLNDASYFYFISQAHIHVKADFLDQKHIILYHSQKQSFTSIKICNNI